MTKLIFIEPDETRHEVEAEKRRDGDGSCHQETA